MLSITSKFSFDKIYLFVQKRLNNQGDLPRKNQPEFQQSPLSLTPETDVSDRAETAEIQAEENLVKQESLLVCTRGSTMTLRYSIALYKEYWDFKEKLVK